MGKQSTRLYFEGKDHLDVAGVDENGYCYNHSKMYRGSTLLWKREKAKYIFLCGLYAGGHGTGSMYTAESLNTLSAFHEAPVNMAEYKQEVEKRDFYGFFTDIEYAFEQYFSILYEFRKKGDTAIYEEKQYLCCSEDGYEWKKIKEFDTVNMLCGIKRYFYEEKEALVAIQKKNISFMDKNNGFEEVYAIPLDYQPANCKWDGMNIRAKKGVMIIQCHARVIVINNDRFTTYMLGKDHDITDITDTTDEGYFFRGSLLPPRDYAIYASKDGSDWKMYARVTDFTKMMEEITGYATTDFLFEQVTSGNILYLFARPNGAEVPPVVFKIGENSVEMDVLDTEHSGLYLLGVVDGCFIFADRVHDTYWKFKDGFEAKEEIRITCRLNWNGIDYFGRLRTIACRDKNAAISITSTHS